MDERSGIYEIRNVVNGKRYIGSAVNLAWRKTKHITNLSRSTHHSIILQRAWAQHGAAAFEFKTLILCERKDLMLYEQKAMDAFNPEYNVVKNAGKGRLGVKNRPESIAALKANRKTWSPSEETRKKISDTLTGRAGHKHTEASKAKMSLIQKETAIRTRANRLPGWERKIGVPRTLEVKEKLSKANARLSENQVRDIRTRYQGGELQKQLASVFGLAESCISEIVCFKTYKWVK